MKTTLALAILFSGFSAMAGPITTKTDFIRACIEQIAPDARADLRLECEAKNSSEQTLIEKFDLSSVDFNNASVGFQRVNNRDYFLEVSTKVGGFLRKKLIIIDCRQNVKNPDTVTVSGHKPVSIQVENLIDTTVRVELSCRSAR